jgi:hypothetical protein
LSPRVWLSLSALFGAAGLFGCSSIGSLVGSGGGTATEVEVSASPQPQHVSLVKSKPMDVYVAMGGIIKRCWFNPVDGILPKYVYRADVSPSGRKVQISVHNKIELGRAGGMTYLIDFKPSGPSTVITTQNKKMPPELAAKMQFDIDRWKRGATDCSREMPAVAAAPAGTAGPAAAPPQASPSPSSNPMAR